LNCFEFNFERIRNAVSEFIGLVSNIQREVRTNDE